VATEIEGRRRLREIRPDYYVGVRTLVCLKTAAIQDAADLWDTDWPDDMPEDRHAPSVNDVQIIYHPEGVVGLAWLVVSYKSTGITGANPLGLGKATIWVRRRSRFVRRKKDNDGTLVEGFEDDGIHEWRIVQGSNFVPEEHVEFVVSTMCKREDVPHALLNSVVGFINLGAFSHLFIAGEGKIRCTGATERYSMNRYVRLDIQLEYSRTEWRLTTYTQKGVWLQREIPVVDEIGADTDKTRVAMVYHQGMEWNGSVLVATTPEACRFWEPVDMSWIDSLELW